MGSRITLDLPGNVNSLQGPWNASLPNPLPLQTSLVLQPLRGKAHSAIATAGVRLRRTAQLTLLVLCCLESNLDMLHMSMEHHVPIALFRLI